MACVSQAQTDEFLPEVDAYYKLNSDLRIAFQAKQTREGGEPTKAEIGPSLELYFKPWFKLRNAVLFDLDEVKSRPIVLAMGYRYMPAPGQPATQRFEPVLTFNFPLRGRILLMDKNRGDLDWQNGQFTWRYRNRPTLERSIDVRGYHPAPYVSAEFFYQSQYGKWSDTALYAGCLFPIRRRIQLDTYYEHQNLTGTAPNQQLNQFGVILNLFFVK